MKILLTAKKGMGKSTVIEKFVKLYTKTVSGFVISRMKDRNNENQGFLAKTFDGRIELLSHKKLINSEYIAGDGHGVDIDVVDNFLSSEIVKSLSKDCLLIIDEIGRMQAISQKFLDSVEQALNSTINLLATIVYEDELWSLSFKNNPNVKIIEVTEENRDSLPEDLVKMFE